MFEAVVLVCLSLSGDICRHQLIPGYEAQTKPACEAALAKRPPVSTELGQAGDPVCQALGPALAFEEVAPGVFAHLGAVEEPNGSNLGDVANIGFVIGSDSVAVIDSGSARWIGEAIWRAIRARTDKPVNHVILTHMHPDHVLGASVLAEAGAEVVGHTRLARALADRQENYRESLSRLIGEAGFLGTVSTAVARTVTDRTKIDLGDRVLELRAWPLAHTGSDVTVLDQQSGTLFTGDLVFHQHTPALDGELLGWRVVLQILMASDALQVVPGHGGPVLPWPQGGEDLKRYLATLERDTRAAVDAGERLGDAITHIADSEAPQWDLFDAYNPRNATVAFTELEWE